jgi:hypothetical protein
MKLLQQIQKDEKDYPEVLRYCPCSVCNKINRCQAECIEFKLYINIPFAKKRLVSMNKKYNETKLAELVSKN